VLNTLQHDWARPRAQKQELLDTYC